MKGQRLRRRFSGRFRGQWGRRRLRGRERRRIRWRRPWGGVDKQRKASVLSRQRFAAKGRYLKMDCLLFVQRAVSAPCIHVLGAFCDFLDYPEKPVLISSACEYWGLVRAAWSSRAVLGRSSKFSSHHTLASIAHSTPAASQAHLCLAEHLCLQSTLRFGTKNGCRNSLAARAL